MAALESFGCETNESFAKEHLNSRLSPVRTICLTTKVHIYLGLQQFRHIAEGNGKERYGKILSKLRKTDYYDFGHGLTLMNILYKTEEGNLDRIETYLGVEANDFISGVAKGLSEPGVLFSYAEYTRFQRANRAA